MRVLVVTCALAALTACSPTVPDSAAGVGFDNYDSYRSASAPSGRSETVPLSAPGTISAERLEGGAAAPVRQVIPVRTAPAGTAPVRTAPVRPAAPAAAAPAAAAPAAPAAPATPARPARISDEQDFSAVSARETIESDAARLAANRAAYVQIQPTDLPQREGDDGPSIVAYALATNNPVGVQLYRRSFLSGQARFRRNCAKYTSSDLAQEDFLRRGGPLRDPKGLDPDGDGFACYWNPTPLRQVRAAAKPAPAPAPEARK